MPCRDYQDDYSVGASREVAQLRARNDELARYACLFATALEAFVMPDDLYETLEKVSPKYAASAVEWWKKHKKADAAEQARLAKKAAIAKKGRALLQGLTPEDREALEAIGVSIPEVSPAQSMKLNLKKRFIPKK